LPILLDPNVYLFALRSPGGAVYFERQFSTAGLQDISVECRGRRALRRGARPTGVGLIEDYVGALERAGRVTTPNFQDWKDAGTLVARITRQEPSRKAKVQQMLNDILLALNARRLGADLFTFSRKDFELIRRHRSFSLKVLKPVP